MPPRTATPAGGGSAGGLKPAPTKLRDLQPNDPHPTTFRRGGL